MRLNTIGSRVIPGVIAVLLAWVAIGLFFVSAHAQPAAANYAVVELKPDWATMPASLTKSINDAAQGRELVSVIRYEQPGRYLAVFK